MTLDRVDIETQIRLVVTRLEAMLPICAQAGVVTKEASAYDEWEELVAAVFRSFVAHPSSEDFRGSSVNSFQRMGFEPEAGKTVILFTAREARWYLSDFVNVAGAAITICGRKLARLSQGEQHLRPNECKEFEIGRL